MKKREQEGRILAFWLMVLAIMLAGHVEFISQLEAMSSFYGDGATAAYALYNGTTINGADVESYYNTVVVSRDIDILCLLDDKTTAHDDDFEPIILIDYKTMGVSRKIWRLVDFKPYKTGDNHISWNKDAYATSYTLYCYGPDSDSIIALYQMPGNATEFYFATLMCTLNAQGSDYPKKGYSFVIMANDGDSILSMDQITNVTLVADSRKEVAYAYPNAVMLKLWDIE